MMKVHFVACNAFVGLLFLFFLLSMGIQSDIYFIHASGLVTKRASALSLAISKSNSRGRFDTGPTVSIPSEQRQSKIFKLNLLRPIFAATGGLLLGILAMALHPLLGKVQRKRSSWQLMSIAGPVPEESNEPDADGPNNILLEPEAEPFAVDGIDDVEDLSQGQMNAFEEEAKRLASGFGEGLGLAGGSIPDELLPKIAIVGMPNVGKSELFNRLTGEVKAVVHNTPGVTRDRMYGRGDWAGRDFVVIDTGGLTQVPEEMSYGLSEAGVKNLPAEIEKQAAIAVEQSDAIIFMVDGRQGVNSGDAKIAEWLKQRHGRKPTFMAVNKCESTRTLATAHDFWQYGLEPHPISANHGSGVGEFLSLVVERLPPPRRPKGSEANPDSKELRVAIVGRPNVGKSSILNAIVGQERAVVSDVAGTTRDSVDTLIVGPGDQSIRLVDTAGIRKRAKVGARSNKDTFEHMSVASALKAMKKADVVCLVVEATEDVTVQDFRLAELIAQEGRACVIVVNKWDIVKKQTVANKKKKELEEGVQACLRPVKWAPVVFVSALRKKGMGKVLRQVITVWENHAKRITTSTLNIVVREAFGRNMVSSPSGRRARVYYATQVAVHPPMFLFFVNDVKPFMKNSTYQTFLEKQLREAVGFEGTPLRFLWRASLSSRRKPLAPVRPQADPNMVGI
eukprot:GGOE01062147.1.p1 GENE.GGOE01062147.1~~GGOE01062147.1.p1  ORF type:complete len:678 (+),score=117.46 GGOE01062147.1:39-2072(+)